MTNKQESFQLSLREIINEIGGIDIAKDMTEEEEKSFYECVKVFITYQDVGRKQLLLPFGHFEGNDEIVLAGHGIKEGWQQLKFEIEIESFNGAVTGVAVDVSKGLQKTHWLLEEFCMNLLYLLAKCDGFSVETLYNRAKSGFFATEEFSLDFFRVAMRAATANV